MPGCELLETRCSTQPGINYYLVNLHKFRDIIRIDAISSQGLN